jgi:hypothetical protein
MASPNADVIKTRTMLYMNANRPESLEDYLRFYNSINATPQSAKLLDFDLDFMKIEYADKSGTKQSAIIKIDPPMSSLSESRVRLASRSEEASGKSFHQPPDLHPASAPSQGSLGWTPPEFVGYGSLVSICFGFWALSHSYPLSPEGPLQNFLPVLVIELSRKYRDYLFAMMIGIHVIEGGIVARKCLEEKVSWPLLILWTINGVFEGGPAIMRINKLIEKRRK